MWEPIVIFAAVLLAAMIVVLLVVLRHARRMRRSRETIDDGVREDVTELMTALAGLADEIDRRTGDRLEALRRLCAEADEKISRLREPSRAEAPPAAPIGGTSRAEILRLSNHGLTNVEIAQRMGLRVGEVDLVLRLTRTAAAKPSAEKRDP